MNSHQKFDPLYILENILNNIFYHDISYIIMEYTKQYCLKTNEKNHECVRCEKCDIFLCPCETCSGGKCYYCSRYACKKCAVVHRCSLCEFQFHECYIKSIIRDSIETKICIDCIDKFSDEVLCHICGEYHDFYYTIGDKSICRECGDMIKKL